MPRNLSVPKNPEFLGRLIAAVRLGSGERQPQNATERELLVTLGARGLRPATATRLRSSFDAIPADQRRRFLGRAAEMVVLPDTTLASHENAIAGSGVSREFRVNGDVRAHVVGSTIAGGAVANGALANSGAVVGSNTGTVLDPEVGGSIAYTVRYQGLYCQEETDGPGSDEIYVITSVATTNQGQNVVTDAMKHPVNHPDNVYEEIDTGSERLGPVQAVWRGNPDYFSLVVTVWEHDQGDPNAYREEVDYLVKAAIAVAEKYYPPAKVLEFFSESIVDGINWLLGTGDDLLTTETAVFTRDQLESTAMGQPGFYYGTKPTGLLQHFVTTHKADGATYRVGFDIDRNPPRPAPVIL